MEYQGSSQKKIGTEAISVVEFPAQLFRVFAINNVKTSLNFGSIIKKK